MIVDGLNDGAKITSQDAKGLNMTWSILMVRALVLLITIAGSCIPPGCFTVDVRAVEWPGVHVRKELGWFLLPHSKPIRFDSVEIDMAKTPPPFALKMPDGTVIASDALSHETLDKYFTPFEKLSRPLHESWATDSHIEYRKGRVSVSFEKGRVRRVMLFDDLARLPGNRKPGATAPSIGKKEGLRFFTLPISEEDLMDVFGKPTRASTYLFDT